jgi:hypothetical protein
VKTAVDFCDAGRKQGMRGKFVERMATLGACKRWESNYEEEFHRLAKKTLGVHYEMYKVATFVRDRIKVTRSAQLSVLLPHEVVHLLWLYDRPRFDRIFSVHKIVSFWRKTIERDEPWFRGHPLRDEIIAADDKSKFLPVTIFGDDATMRKTRMLHTITWLTHVLSIPDD